MNSITIRVFVLSTIVLLCACSSGPTTKPGTGAQNCSSFMRSISFEDYLADQDVESLAEQDLLPTFFTAPVATLKDRAPSDDGRVELNILVLSGGGQWGAYGAGFLNGWSEIERVAPDHAPWMARGDVDIITGISTGSMQSSLAFAGINASSREAADNSLRKNYTPANASDIVKEKNLLWVLLTGGNGTFNPKPLEQSVARMIDEFGPVIRDGAPDNRQLVVGLVNLRTGRLHLADMRETLKAGRQDCYKEFLLGSSAVPGTFPPRFIDGDMYVDGGVRLGLFLPLFWESLTYEARKYDLEPSDIRVKILTIVNGSLSANHSAECEHNPSMCPEQKNKLLPIAMRAVETLTDTVYNFSAFIIRQRAEQYGFKAEFRMTYASLDIVQLGGCKKEGHFDPVFMKCLYGLGFDDGKNQTWRDPFAAR